MQNINMKSTYPAVFFRAGRLDLILIRHRFQISSGFQRPTKTRKRRFQKFHSGERFQKVAFSVTVFIGYG